MIYDVRNYGAVGDGITLNTKSIQAAIDDCAKRGGGRVLLEDGKYLSGSIELRSFVELHIAQNAVLLGSTDCADFPERKNLKHVNSSMLPRERNACFIFADECENVALTGMGTIDCNGDKFVVYRGDDAMNWVYKRIDAPTPPRVVFFTGCKNVKIEDVTMTNQPAGWSYWIHDCDVVTIDRIKIFAKVDYPNNDGIHINCSRNVTVSNCNITCGDDCIIVRANSVSLKENKVCEKVCVNNCNLTSYSGGVRVGWINDGVIRNCTFSNLVMTDTSVGISIFIPEGKRPEISDVGREETVIERLTFDNIVMDGVCSEPIKIHLLENEHAKVKRVSNLYFSNIHAKGPHFCTLVGRENCHVENVHFNDCDFEITDCSQFPNYNENAYKHGATSFFPKYEPMHIRHVKGIKFHNVEFTVI